MSVHAVSWAFKQDLPCAHKFVLVVIADCARADNTSSPSDTYLAHQCGLSEEEVQEIVDDLEGYGFVTSNADGGYWLAIPDAAPDRSPPIDMPGYLYVVANEGRTKIGITRSLKARVSALQTGIPTEVTLHASYSLPLNMARSIERAVHERLAEHRLKGEWFSITPAEAIEILEALVGGLK